MKRGGQTTVAQRRVRDTVILRLVVVKPIIIKLRTRFLDKAYFHLNALIHTGVSDLPRRM
jgi:hypothetical protein